ncbi:radical SAM protein [Caloramator sp. mosi_1]|uniref:radical SAM/SPASM domain-containing protein n=1 Tax=Caloramator sp. mosi_1 TaxID=3023090 RepID=UPI0023603291|nr:radical SAM protein [Caloramator sp. mosi_1]WDC83284.1 radical SAM protein [Caloramator sp. mosi_1]
MKSDIVKGITPGGKRAVLGDVLPLSNPFLVQIFPVYSCNFRCNYCIYALPKSRHGYISNKVFIELDMFKKCIDDMVDANWKLKMLRFAGIGEPLLHKDIDFMIKYAKDNNIADSVDIVTNGVLLNEKLSMRLIEAGIDKLRISIQGISTEHYKNVCDVNIDFDKFVKNIEYFYKNRGRTKVYIKIINSVLKDDEYNVFLIYLEIFVMRIAIENLTPTVKGIDYTKITKNDNFNLTQNGTLIIDTQICPQPFYMMQINPDGCVVPCCSMSYPLVIGNILEEKIAQIWNGKKFNEFRRNMLEGVKNASNVCSECSLYKYGTYKEDVLDSYAEQLKNLY